MCLVLFLVDLLSICSEHITHAFQSECTFYSCLNVKTFLARNKELMLG